MYSQIIIQMEEQEIFVDAIEEDKKVELCIRILQSSFFVYQESR